MNVRVGVASAHGVVPTGLHLTSSWIYPHLYCVRHPAWVILGLTPNALILLPDMDCSCACVYIAQCSLH